MLAYSPHAYSIDILLVYCTPAVITVKSNGPTILIHNDPLMDMTVPLAINREMSANTSITSLYVTHSFGLELAPCC